MPPPSGVRASGLAPTIAYLIQDARRRRRRTSAVFRGKSAPARATVLNTVRRSRFSRAGQWSRCASPDDAARAAPASVSQRVAARQLRTDRQLRRVRRGNARHRCDGACATAPRPHDRHRDGARGARPRDVHRDRDHSGTADAGDAHRLRPTPDAHEPGRGHGGGDGHGGYTRTLTADYWYTVPGSKQVVVATFSTPMGDIPNLMLDYFDAVVRASYWEERST